MVDLHQPEMTRSLYPSLRVQHWTLFVILSLMLYIGLFILIPHVWIPALRSGGLIYDSLDVFLSQVGFIGQTSVYMLAMGLYAGGALLWLFDTFKIIQAVIHWGGIIVCTVLFWRHWPVTIGEETYIGGLLFCFGFVSILQLTGIPLLQRYTRFGDRDKKKLLSRHPREFKTAVKFTFEFVILITFLGVLDSVTSGGLTIQDQIRVTLGSVLVVTPLYVFQKYADAEKIIQLGPAKSGKTSIQGGLYKSVNQPIQKESPLLDEIVEEYMDRGEFPDRTQINEITGEKHSLHFSNLDDGDYQDSTNGDVQTSFIIEFTYVTRRDMLFPKKRTITAIDYPGELLTGLVDTSPLSEYIANQDLERTWDDVMEDWVDEDNEITPGQFMEDLSYLVQYADWILFTLPMDDFLADLVHDRPDLIPRYHRKSLHKIEERETGDGTEFVKIPISGNGASETVSAEHNKWLGNDRRYVRDKNSRTHPNNYLAEYDNIINALDDTKNHNFMWLTTMSDLPKEDFFGPLEDACETNIRTNPRTTKIDCDGDDIEISPESDINIELVEELFAKTASIQFDDHYVLFSRWLQERYINQYHPNVYQSMWETFERHVFPVWFDIADEDEREFETSEEPILNGSQYVLRRLNGSRFKDEYPSWSRVIRYKYFGGDKVISKSTMGYEILEALRESDSDNESEGIESTQTSDSIPVDQAIEQIDQLSESPTVEKRRETDSTAEGER